MKIRHISIILLISLFAFSCKEKTQKENPFLKNQQQTEQNIEDKGEVIDHLEQKRRNLDKDYSVTQNYIANLQAKADSLQELITQIERQANDINNNNLKNSIDFVSLKLNELKNQRANTISNIDLNKKKLDVAGQMIAVLNKEKKMYEEQKQALWNKGAAPEEFIEVNSSIEKIDADIVVQKRKIKKISREIEDLEESIVSIDKSSKSLSKKIRSKYSAQQIFSEYYEEEKTRIGKQVNAINKELEPYLDKENKLIDEIDVVDTKIDIKEYEQKQLIETKKEIQQKKQIELQKKEEKVKKKKQGTLAVVIIAFILLLVYFYFVGKKKKSKNIK